MQGLRPPHTIRALSSEFEQPVPKRYPPEPGERAVRIIAEEMQVQGAKRFGVITRVAASPDAPYQSHSAMTRRCSVIRQASSASLGKGSLSNFAAGRLVIAWSIAAWCGRHAGARSITASRQLVCGRRDQAVAKYRNVPMRDSVLVVVGGGQHRQVVGRDQSRPLPTTDARLPTHCPVALAALGGFREDNVGRSCMTLRAPSSESVHTGPRAGVVHASISRPPAQPPECDRSSDGVRPAVGTELQGVSSAARKPPINAEFFKSI